MNRFCVVILILLAMVFTFLFFSSCDPDPPTGYDQLNAKVAHLRFFESGRELPSYGDRVYDTLFDSQSARYICYELGLTYKAPGKQVSFTLDVVYYNPDGSQLYRTDHNATVDADWKGSVHAGGYGSNQPGNWQEGNYQVKIYEKRSGSLLASESFLVSSDPVDPALTIADYYPKEGPAGSSVYLKFEEPVLEVLEDLKAVYNGKEIPFSGVAEDIIKVETPFDSGSGNIEVRSGSSTSNAVYFTVLETEMVPLTTETVSPSSTLQSITYNDEITINIPAGIISDRSRTLSIFNVLNPPPNEIAPFGKSIAYDVSIEGMEQLSDFIEITVKYDPVDLNPEYADEDQLFAMRWDPGEKYWTPLAYQVDPHNKVISFYTDHLSTFVIGSMAVGILSIPVTWVGEKVLNDVYITPEGNFRFLYSKKWFENSDTFRDLYWERKTYATPLYPIGTYSAKYSKAIQDIGNLHEKALQHYVSSHKFKDPITKPGWIWGTSKYPITVKVDSWWVVLGGSPNYEKIWENLHLPTVYLSDYTTGSSYGTIGHELFHRLQAEYYGRSGFLKSSYFWWIEATAEYAGYRAAWSAKKFDGLHDKTGSDFFSYPVSTTGIIGNQNGWHPEQRYEYAASAFVQFLVEKKGLNFKDMIEHVATGNPMEKLNGYNGLNLSDTYMDFAARGIFCTDSFLNQYDIAEIADDTVELAVSEDSLETVLLTVSGANESCIHAYIFDTPFNRAANIPTPVFSVGSVEEYEVDVRTDNILYFIGSNPGKNDETVQITLTVKQKETENGKPQDIESKHTMVLRGGYSAKLWSVEITASDVILTIIPDEIRDAKADQKYTFHLLAENIPATINSIYFQWDFGCYSGSHTTGTKVVPVTDGSAEYDISYEFPSGHSDCTVTVSVKDLMTDTELAKAEAKVYFNTVTIQGSRIIVYELPQGQTSLQHDFEAVANPEGVFRYDWDFGDDVTFSDVKYAGERSTVTHTYRNLKHGDIFHPKVILRPAAGGDPLATDSISITIEESATGWSKTYTRTEFGWVNKLTIEVQNAEFLSADVKEDNSFIILYFRSQSDSVVVKVKGEGTYQGLECNNPPCNAPAGFSLLIHPGLNVSDGFKSEESFNAYNSSSFNDTLTITGRGGTFRGHFYGSIMGDRFANMLFRIEFR